MKFKKIIIDNFLGIGHVELDFDYNGLVLVNGKNKDSPISDSNGSGKSTIPEAILWCLYGATKRGLKADEIVNRTTGKDCIVKLYFDDYCVVRTRLHSDFGNSLRVFQSGVEITKGTTGATQELVEELIGKGRLSFEKLFHFGQGDTQPLASMTDANLKTIFEQSFNLGFIQDCFARVKTAEKERVEELTKTKMWASELQSKIWAATENIQSLEMANAEFTNNVNRQIDSIQAEIKANQDRIIEIQKTQTAWEKAKYPVPGEWEKKRASLGDQIRKAKETVALLTKAASEANAKYQVAIRDGKSYRDSLVKLYEDKKKAEEKVGCPCPTCKKTINKEDVVGVVEAVSSKITEESKKIDEYRDMMADADRQLKHQQKLLATAEQALNKAMEGQESQAIIWQKFVEMEKQLTEVETTMKTIESAKKRIEELTNQTNTIPDQIKGLLSKVAEDAAAKNELDKEVEKRSIDLETIGVLSEIFGNAGLKSYIFDSITPRLNELINRYLSRLDDISIEFTTQKQLKSGDLREKFDIIVNTQNGPSSFDALSGGEKQRVSLAISLAMNKLMREVAGDPMNVLFLDEVAEALDESSSEAVFGLIQDFADDIDNVFIISHNQNLKDIVPTVITIVKEGGRAYLG